MRLFLLHSTQRTLHFYFHFLNLCTFHSGGPELHFKVPPFMGGKAPDEISLNRLNRLQPQWHGRFPALLPVVLGLFIPQLQIKPLFVNGKQFLHRQASRQLEGWGKLQVDSLFLSNHSVQWILRALFCSLCWHTHILTMCKFCVCMPLKMTAAWNWVGN